MLSFQFIIKRKTEHIKQVSEQSFWDIYCLKANRHGLKPHNFDLTEQMWSLEDTLAVLNARYNKKAVLEMFVWPDDRDSSRYIIHVSYGIYCIGYSYV